MTSSSTTSKSSSPAARHETLSAALRSRASLSLSASFFASSKFCRPMAASFSWRIFDSSASIFLCSGGVDIRRIRKP